MKKVATFATISESVTASCPVHHSLAEMFILCRKSRLTSTAATSDFGPEVEMPPILHMCTESVVKIRPKQVANVLRIFSICNNIPDFVFLTVIRLYFAEKAFTAKEDNNKISKKLNMIIKY